MMAGVFLFNFPLDGYMSCMPKYNILFSLSWQETFYIIETSKERQHSASTLCTFGNYLKHSCKTIVLVHLGETGNSSCH